MAIETVETKLPRPLWFACCSSSFLEFANNVCNTQVPGNKPKTFRQQAFILVLHHPNGIAPEKVAGSFGTVFFQPPPFIQLFKAGNQVRRPDLNAEMLKIPQKLYTLHNFVHYRLTLRSFFSILNMRQGNGARQTRATRGATKMSQNDIELVLLALQVVIGLATLITTLLKA